MGLSIEYKSFHDYVADRFEDSANPKRSALQFIERIKKAVEQQTGSPLFFKKEHVPKNLEGFKYGNYSEIHFLRMYAARVSGYTLDEAYELETVSLDPANTVEEETEEGDEDYSTEDEFKEIWGEPIDKVFKKKPQRDTPFKFKNLVCFPDSEGIYIPYDFKTPIQYRSVNVASSKHLFIELEEIHNHLRRDLVAAMDSKAMVLEQYLLYVRQLWWRLYIPCKESSEKGCSFFFV